MAEPVLILLKDLISISEFHAYISSHCSLAANLMLEEASQPACLLLSSVLWSRSTAMEVALKMAFRKFLADRPPLLKAMKSAENTKGIPTALGVLGLANAYHGDTLGTMDAVAPSPYNGLRQTPW